MVDVAAVSLSPEFLAAYELTKPLGAGAMGVVWRGVQRSTGRPVAIKFLARAANEELIARFEREARVLAKINHPAVLHVYDVGTIERHPYLVTELLEGGDLRRRLTAPMPWRIAVPMMITCLEGLAAVHAAQVVHRDLKPENIFFDAQDNPRVADFGIAREEASAERLTASGVMLGTPIYMAPEQLGAGFVDAVSDVWSMGAVLHEMLTGRPLYDVTSLVALLEAHERPLPAFPVSDVPQRLRDVLTWTLSAQPGDRPQSARSLAAELTAVMTSSRTGSRAPRATPRPRASSRGPALALAAGGALALVAFALRPAPRIDPPAPTATPSATVSATPAPAKIGLLPAAPHEARVRFSDLVEVPGLELHVPARAIVHPELVGMAASADGKRLVTWGGSRARVWDVATRRRLAEVVTGEPIAWAAADPTGELVTVCDMLGVVLLSMREHKVYHYTSMRQLVSGAFLPGQNAVVMVEGKHVTRLNLSRRISEGILNAGQSGFRVVVSGDGARIAAVGPTNQLAICTIADRSVRFAKLPETATGEVWDGDRLLVGTATGLLTLDVTGAVLGRRDVPGGCTDLAHDGATVRFLSRGQSELCRLDREILRARLDDHTRPRLIVGAAVATRFANRVALPGDDPLRRVVWLPDGRLAIDGEREREIWDISSKQHVREPSPGLGSPVLPPVTAAHLPSPEGELLSAATSPDGKRIAICATGGVYVLKR